MLDRADCADFGCHNSIRLETKHFLNTLALTFISFSGRFVFAMQKHYLFFASDPLVLITPGWPNMPWFWDLVAMSSHIPLNLPNLPSLFTAIQSDPSQKSDKSISPCRAPRASAIEEQDLSEAVARNEAPQRGGGGGGGGVNPISL